jgi:CheY-like chemotaxis protein
MEELFDIPAASARELAGCVLVVDDDPVATALLGATLAGAGHRVVEACSGEEALAHFAACADGDASMPETVFLDIEMGMGIDGYETCRRLRAMEATADVPVIFLSSHGELEDRLHAYDVGGSDFMSKPFVPDEVLRKAALSIRHLRQQQANAKQGRSAFDTAMTALNSLGESGVTLRFGRDALGCRTLHGLATTTLRSLNSFGLDCHVQLRVPSGRLSMTPCGPASPLEESVFEKMSSMGRIFSFKNRTIINYDKVSILIRNMPLEDEDLCGRIRDHGAMIAEAADLAADNIDLRNQVVTRAEELHELANETRQAVDQLRSSYREMQTATRTELETMTTHIERMYHGMGLSDNQESAISGTVRDAVERVLTLMAHSTQLDNTFAGILAGLAKAGECTVSQDEGEKPTVDLW